MVFAREHFSDFAMELGDLLKLHHAEVGWKADKIPLKLDWGTYMRLDEEGTLLSFTAREGADLRGYAIFLTTPHLLHSLTRMAINHMIFVHPSNRGTAGPRLIEYAERELKALGIEVVGYHVQKRLDWSPILARKGYEEGEVSWLKWIGE